MFPTIFYNWILMLGCFLICSQVEVAPVPFKNDGSFLEQFKQMQQQSSGVMPFMPCGPPPVLMTIPPHAPLPTAAPPPPATARINVSVPPPPFYTSSDPGWSREEPRRAPSPYSPSRPCEEEDDEEPWPSPQAKHDGELVMIQFWKKQSQELESRLPGIS